MPRIDSAHEQQVKNWLRHSRFCEGVGVDVLEEVARRVSVKAFSAGEELASAGQVATCFTILAEGAIKATFKDLKGREQLLGCANPGDHIGDVALMEHTPRPLTFIATAAGTLLEIPAADFHALVEKHPLLLRNLYRALGGRFENYAGLTKRRAGTQTVAVVGLARHAAALAAKIARRLREAGERVSSTGVQGTEVSASRLNEEGDRSCQWLIVVVSADAWQTLDAGSLIGVDAIIWAAEPGDSDAARQKWVETARLVRDLEARSRLVWLLPAERPLAPPAIEWNLAWRPISMPISPRAEAPDRLERQAIDRLYRTLAGYSIGVALAGGGARGMAHLGVLRALDNAGIGIDLIAGTSCGAMVGVFYAAGMEPGWAAEQFQRDLTPSRFFRRIPRGREWYLLAKFRRGAWDAMLRRYLHRWRLEQLPIACCAVAVDLVAVEEVVLDHGDAARAILESINLPGISRPIVREGMALVDGGVLNNLPANVLAQRNADFIIGVDVSSRLRAEFAGIRRGEQPLVGRRASTLETLLRVFEAQAHGLRNVSCGAVDFWITPDTEAFDFIDFSRATELAAAGEAAAQEAMPRLKERIAELEQRLRAGRC